MCVYIYSPADAVLPVPAPCAGLKLLARLPSGLVFSPSSCLKAALASFSCCSLLTTETTLCTLAGTAAMAAGAAACLADPALQGMAGQCMDGAAVYTQRRPGASCAYNDMQICLGPTGSIQQAQREPVDALAMTGRLTWLCQLQLRLPRPWQVLWPLLPWSPSAWRAAGAQAAWPA